MDLNHARLPIPPRWQSELQGSGGREAAVGKTNSSIFAAPPQAVKHRRGCRGLEAEARSLAYPSLAVIEIFAFSTFDTGHPFSAASAYF